MRRLVRLVVVVLVGLLAPFALHGYPVAVAQDATPAGEEMALEGITFESVTFAPGLVFPSQGDMFVARATLEAGAAVPIEESDPTFGFLLVESGTLTVQVDTPMSVTRSGELDAAMATAEASGDFSGMLESIAEGQAVTLEAGDAAYIPANSAGEIRNAGQEQAVALAFLVFPLTEEATPTP
jgi:quercetin dioxygenase-like cupin family protein